MFDSSKIFRVKIISGGVKAADLKYPSDADFCERARRQRTVRNFIGRGKSTTTSASTDEVDLQLFRKLAVNDAEREGVDAADASAFIDRLDRAEISSADWEGEAQRRVEMKVPGAEVVHVLRIPTQAEMREHERASTHAVYGARSAEIRVNLEPSGKLYDKIKVSAEGYSGAVPVNHKAAAVANLLEALPSLIEEEEGTVPDLSRPAPGQSDRASAS